MKCSVRILAGAVMLLTLAGCNTTQGPTATEPLGYAEATGSIDPIDPLPPLRRLKKHVFLLMGGLNGGDGWVTSAGMYGLRSSLMALLQASLSSVRRPFSKPIADENPDVTQTRLFRPGAVPK